MFGFLWFFTIYIFWHFSNQSIAVAKCRMSFRSISSEVLSVGFWQQQDDFPGSEATEATEATEIPFRHAGSTTWLGREFVVETVVVAQHCGPGPCESCDTWKHVSTHVSSDTLIYFDTFHCTAWWLDHAWPVQILSTYDRASKRGWVSFSVCLVKSCEAGIEVILKLCWTSHFILGLLSNGKIERMRQSKCAMRQFHKIWNDFQFVAKLQFA